MRAPGKASARPGLAGLRAPMAASLPVREAATPPAKAWAMLPGPRMPQRMGVVAVIVISLKSGWGRLGSAQPQPFFVEQVGFADGNGDLGGGGNLRRVALDHHVLAMGCPGVEKARAAEMLNHVDGHDEVGAAF